MQTVIAQLYQDLDGRIPGMTGQAGQKTEKKTGNIAGTGNKAANKTGRNTRNNPGKETGNKTNALLNNAHVVQIQNKARKAGIQVKLAAHYVDFIKDGKILRISLKHFIYSYDMIDSFDYYFSSVEPMEFQGYELVDYSTPRYHHVVGFGLMPIHFPSLSEPVATTYQYLEFADLKAGQNVIDLGAYAGLTSIIFKEFVGSTGRVIALDADQYNLQSIQKNIDLYTRIRGDVIEAFAGAIWNHGNGLSFSSEGNMGAAVSHILGANRGDTQVVESVTLSGLMQVADLPSVDFIKCDVEGAESVVFEDREFFANHRPKIVIETHLVNGSATADKCIQDLSAYGYTCTKVAQVGATLPLIECRPS